MRLWEGYPAYCGIPSQTRAAKQVGWPTRVPYRTTDAVWPNKIFRSSSVRFTGWP